MNCRLGWAAGCRLSQPKFYPSIHFQLQFTCTWSETLFMALFFPFLTHCWHRTLENTKVSFLSGFFIVSTNFENTDFLTLLHTFVTFFSSCEFNTSSFRQTDIRFGSFANHENVSQSGCKCVTVGILKLKKKSILMKISW